ncbi:hypothetical protein IWQ62_000681 [Dispira parvispora]|uniref:Obg-like ATPase 1 n=1 Tax=Dispira parvispora TaxID=1520584 RepID=A0A9W8AXV6_9FUNG|nr:hypothetical protein IWQ62_000681 [Dispira parvispora]
MHPEDRFPPYLVANHEIQRREHRTSCDKERGELRVFEYRLGEHWIMWDRELGLVYWTGIWQAIGGDKIDLPKALSTDKELRQEDMLMVRGGKLTIQGTWIPFPNALKLAIRTCYNIRQELVPLFGHQFVQQALPPSHPDFIVPASQIAASKRRQQQLNQLNGVSCAPNKRGNQNTRDKNRNLVTNTTTMSPNGPGHYIVGYSPYAVPASAPRGYPSSAHPRTSNGPASPNASVPHMGLSPRNGGLHRPGRPRQHHDSAGGGPVRSITPHLARAGLSTASLHNMPPMSRNGGRPSTHNMSGVPAKRVFSLPGHGKFLPSEDSHNNRNVHYAGTTGINRERCPEALQDTLNIGRNSSGNDSLSIPAPTKPTRETVLDAANVLLAMQRDHWGRSPYSDPLSSLSPMEEHPPTTVSSSPLKEPMTAQSRLTKARVGLPSGYRPPVGPAVLSPLSCNSDNDSSQPRPDSPLVYRSPSAGHRTGLPQRPPCTPTRSVGTALPSPLSPAALQGNSTFAGESLAVHSPVRPAYPSMGTSPYRSTKWGSATVPTTPLTGHFPHGFPSVNLPKIDHVLQKVASFTTHNSPQRTVHQPAGSQPQSSPNPHNPSHPTTTQKGRPLKVLTSTEGNGVNGNVSSSPHRRFPTTDRTSPTTKGCHAGGESSVELPPLKLPTTPTESSLTTLPSTTTLLSGSTAGHMSYHSVAGRRTMGSPSPSCQPSPTHTSAAVNSRGLPTGSQPPHSHSNPTVGLTSMMPPGLQSMVVPPPGGAKRRGKMPPKKQVKEEKVLLGRPSNNLKIGVVGLPNVGKSTFFNTLTNSASAAENYPFCTIDPEESRVAVPDSRFDWLCQQYKPASKVPAYLTVIDIAGLVKGASSGEGLGNAFLSHVRAVDAIFHMVRVFDEADVVHVEGEVDPVRDMEIIHQELRLKDIEFLNKHLEQLAKVTARVGNKGNAADKAKKEELETTRKVLAWVEADNDVRKGEWTNKEVEVINRLMLLTAKPVIYLINMSKKDYIRKKNKNLLRIKEWVDKNNAGDPMIPFSGALESELVGLEPAERDAQLKELGTVSVLPKIIVAGYKALQLIYYFTAGPDEVRAWTIRRFTKAPQAAGTIHTDFERGFIMADVMQYNDLVEHGTEAAVKAAGRYLQKGKDYVVEDGDIIHFKFNVTASGKK